MKKLFYPILLIILSGNFNFCFGQKWLENLPTKKSKSEITFYDYQNAFDQYQKSLNAENGYYRDENGEKVRVSGFKQFKRWEYYMQGIIDPSTGAFPSENAFNVYSEYQKTLPLNRSMSSADWKSLGPMSTIESSVRTPGIGRLNCIAFHPTDLNTYWVGAASGGLWVTYSDGNSWTCLTDNTGVLAVSDIVIPTDYEITKTIYIATGDKDAWDNRSIGILKSTNSGASWNTTGLTFSIASPKMVNRLLIDPNNNEIIIAATTDGVFKTINGGVTWNQQITNLDFIDMEFKPNDFNTLYGAVNYEGKIYTSTNGGMTWTLAYSNSSINRIELAVSENQNGWIYGVASASSNSTLYGILKSTNNGVSFQRIYSSKNLLGRASNGNDNVGQGSYDLSISVSKSDANIIIVGGINTWRSTNGGTAWQIVNHWVGDGAQAVHADKHQLRFRDNGDLFECNDGGLYISKNNGSSWTDKSNGLVISQMYKLGISQLDVNETISGLQDNGTKLQEENGWRDVNSGDGMECIIDYSDKNIQYSTVQNGLLFRTFDKWTTPAYLNDITPASEKDSNGNGKGAWVTPYVIDPNDPATIYAGYSYLYKSIDRGATWTRPNPNSFWSLKIHHIAIAPSNSNTLYLAGYDRIWKTIDGGKNVFNIANNLPLSSGNITSVSVKNDDENTVWVTLGGYTNPGVFQSTNGGQTWVKISNGLPILPAYTLVQNKLLTNEDHLYVGTELGVYFKKGGENWIPFNQGLPNVKIGELEIYYDGNPDLSTLRAATYGRGLWESNLIPQIPIEMEYQNATTVHTNLSKVNPSNKNVEILRIQIDTKGSINPIKLKSINFNTHGTSDINDIESIKMYYSKSKMLFDTLQIVSSISNVINDTIRFNLDQELNNGKNYFWLAYDIKNTAHLGNILDAQLISFKLDTIEYILNQDPVGNRVIELNYCTAGSTLPTSYNYISNVTIGKINNNSSKGQNGYQNFRNISDSLSIGRTIDFKINLNQPFTKDQIRIWVDFNRNGIFEDSNELVYFSPGINTQSLIQGNFLIPSNAIPGSTTMRIRQHYTDFEPNFTSCGTSSWGEVEDYSVILYQQPIAGNASSNSPICVNDSLIIQLQNFFGNIKWQKSKNGLTDWQYCNEGLGYNSSHYKSLIDTSTFFRAEVVLETFSPVYSNIVEVIVNQNPEVYINSTNGLNFCSTETSNLYTESNYYSYTWNTGDTMPSIEVATNGSYFVNVVDNKGCSGISNTIQITVNQNPSVSLSIFGLPTFCFGDSIILATESIDYSFVWSTNNTSQSINVYDSGDYFVMVTDSNGCTAISDTITVLVHTLPDATLLTDGNLSFCFGDSISISCTESSTYLWNSGETSKEIVVKNSGHYLVTVTDSFGCSAISDSIGVVVHNLPEITLTPGGVTTFCKGDSVTLFSSQAVSYLWSSGATTQNITVYNSGNYFINIIDSNNCQAESPPINVVVNELPVPIISSNEPTNFCQGDSITLMSSHAVSYLWNTLDTIRSIIVSKSGDYFVIVTDDNGCKGKSIPLTVVETDNPIANISFSRSPIMCQGDSVILSADNAESYLWSNGSTTQSVIINTEGQYSVTVINSMGCISVSPSITVVINPLPISAIDIIGETSFCQGESVNLKATFAISYVWSNNATTQNINVSTSGTYIVSTTDINGCSAASSPILVTVHSLPTPNISSNGETTFCLGGTVTLTSSSAASYLWLNGSTSQSIDIITTGDYLLTVTDVNGCTGVTSQNVLVNELPRVVIDFIGETSFCKGNQLVISANDAETYLWSTGEITKSVEITETGTYTVSITDANGCVGVSTGINTIVFPLPSSAVTVLGELEFCRNDSLILTADPAKDYLWSTGDSSQTIIVKSSGDYRVTITDSNGCSAISSNHIVKVNDLPFTEIVANGLTNICFGETLILTSSKAVSYLWSNSDENQSIEITASGTYVVTITDDNGCKGVSSPLTITLLPLPSSTITLSGLPVFCDGDSVTIKASSVDSYLWSTGETNQSINTSTSGDYVVTVTDIHGCTAVSTSISITVHPLPLAQIVPDGTTTFCQGKSVTLTADSTLNYKWSTDETSQSIKVSSAGDYVVTVTNENGCSAISLPTTIIVNPLPEAMIVPDGPTTFCLGENVILTASEAQSYAWNSGQTTLSVDITSPGVNVVTVTDANGCSAVSSEILVIVNPLLTPEVIISTPAISVLSCQDVTFTPTPINGGISPTYQWFVNGNPVSISPSFSTSTLINGDWISCLMTSSATCKSTPTATSNTLIMSVSQLPQPTIIISEDTISSVNYKDAQYLYSWYFNGNEVSKSPYIICNQFGSGSYYLVINYNGCTDTSITTDIVCTVPTNDIGNSIYFMVYPNPTTNVINISGINLSSGEFRIEAYNVLGQKLEEKRILSSNDILDSYLDMSSYASGIYTVAVYSETYRQVFKVYKIE